MDRYFPVDGLPESLDSVKKFINNVIFIDVYLVLRMQNSEKGRLFFINILNIY